MEEEEWVSGRAEGWRRREKLLLLQRWAFLFPVPARSKVYRGFNFTFPQPIRAHPWLLERTLTHSENRTGSSLVILSSYFILHFSCPPLPIYLPPCLFALDHGGQNSRGWGGVKAEASLLLYLSCSDDEHHDNIMWSKTRQTNTATESRRHTRSKQPAERRVYEEPCVVCVCVHVGT